MKIHKGIVADINEKDDTAIVLTDDGDIKKVELNGIPYKMGDEIVFCERTRQKKHFIRSRAFRYVSVLAAGLMFFFSNPLPISDLGGLIGGKKDAYAASIYVESKSNIKVGVNQDHEVVSVEPLNDPAKIVLKGMNWNGGQISDFVVEYFAAAKQTGYLGPCDKAIIAVDPANDSEKQPTIQTIQKDVEQSPFVKENDIQVLTVAVPDVVVKKAEDLGLTPGKFSIYLAASASGEQMPPVDMLKVASVTDLVDAVPVVAKVLPTYNDKQLAQLAQNEYAAATPKESQPKTASSTSDSKGTSSTTTQNTTSSKDTKPADSSKSAQSDPVISSGGSSSPKQSDDTKKQQSPSDSPALSKPDPQPKKEDSNSPDSAPSKQQAQQGDNSPGGSDSTEQPEQQPAKQEGQPATSNQPAQPDSKKQPGSQPQEGQTQGQPQNSQPSQPQNNSSQPQSSSSQPQGSTQPQDSQPQSSQTQPNTLPSGQRPQDPTQPQGQQPLATVVLALPTQ